MRRGIALVVAALLVLPAAALAARRVIHGKAGGGSGTVDITLVAKKGVVKKLTRFEFNNIQASCKGFPPTAVSNQFPHTIKVDSDGSFAAKVKLNSGRVTYTVSGDFKNQNSASGKLRVKGAVPGCPKADTGTVHWSASHN
ncbi:MAG TPA: hypothetical protein VJU60_10370 [Thermoleophilaceae bacterium]|nr:hypothetical protein [Thermoleophilaceae bacterium]